MIVDWFYYLLHIILYNDIGQGDNPENTKPPTVHWMKDNFVFGQTYFHFSLIFW